MVKQYEPYPIMLRFHRHQGITKGEIISETFGDKVIRFKVLDIRSVKADGDIVEVIVIAREIPETQKTRT